jgi:hypothetical protein
MPSVAVIAAMAVLQLSSFADAHGYLSVPRSRNLVARQNNQFYAEPDLITRNPSGLENYQDLLFPEMNPGAHEGEGIVNNPCGTFPDMNLGEINFGENNRPTWYGEVQARYQPGDTIEVEWVLTVQHYGRYSFRICPYIGDTATAADEQCFLDHVLPGKLGSTSVLPGTARSKTRLCFPMILHASTVCFHGVGTPCTHRKSGATARTSRLAVDPGTRQAHARPRPAQHHRPRPRHRRHYLPSLLQPRHPQHVSVTGRSA